MDQNIISLEISMNNLLFMTLSNTVDNLFEDSNGLVFRNFPHRIDFILQRTLVAVFDDHDFQVPILKAFVAL